MKYDKPIMRMSELVKMGFPRSFLDEAYRERGQDFAQKGPKSNSPIFFDTERFEKWRVRKLNENGSIHDGVWTVSLRIRVNAILVYGYLRSRRTGINRTRA